MSTVYLITSRWAYEGSDVLAVHVSLEGAVKHAEKMVAKHEYDHPGQRYFRDESATDPCWNREPSPVLGKSTHCFVVVPMELES